MIPITNCQTSLYSRHHSLCSPCELFYEQSDLLFQLFCCWKYMKIISPLVNLFVICQVLPQLKCFSTDGTFKGPFICAKNLVSSQTKLRNPLGHEAHLKGLPHCESFRDLSELFF
ncbi:unnamed protein product [Ixodes persulcatus]